MVEAQVGTATRVPKCVGTVNYIGLQGMQGYVPWMYVWEGGGEVATVGKAKGRRDGNKGCFYTV